MITPLLAFAMHAQTKSHLPSVTLYGPTAEVLVRECREEVKIANGESGDTATANGCKGFIVGAYDAQSMDGGKRGVRYPVCVNSETTISQLAKVVVLYGDNHPELLSEQAIDFVNAALKHAYPCSK